MDHEWQKLIKGADTTYRTISVAGRSVTTSAETERAGATDGVVPNARSRYPGLNDPTFDFLVRGRNHVNIYKHSDGVRGIADGLRRIGMVRRSEEPVAPFTSAVFEGPAQLPAMVVGQWSVRPVGGRPPYYYRWFVNGEWWCVVANAASCIDDHMLAMAFPEGPVQLTVDVTDADVVTRRTGSLVLVGPSPIQATLAAPSVANVGQTGTWTASVTGGQPPYRYDWSSGQVVTTFANSHSIAYAPTVEGTLTMTVRLTDAVGATATATTQTTVLGPLCGGRILCQ